MPVVHMLGMHAHRHTNIQPSERATHKHIYAYARMRVDRYEQVMGSLNKQLADSHTKLDAVQQERETTVGLLRRMLHVNCANTMCSLDALPRTTGVMWDQLNSRAVRKREEEEEEEEEEKNKKKRRGLHLLMFTSFRPRDMRCLPRR